MKFKRIFAGAVSCAVLFGSISLTALADTTEGTPVTGGMTISTSGAYYLANDITDNIIVKSGAEVTLNLNGKTIDFTAESDTEHAIENHGTLIINGEGTVKGYRNAVYNISGNLTINGGTFTSEIRNGISTESDAVTVINGGDFTGATNAVYNNGKVTINNGTFKTTNTYEEGAALYNGYSAEYDDEGWETKIVSLGTAIINGGNFIAEGYNDSISNYGHLTVSNGSFSINSFNLSNKQTDNGDSSSASFTENASFSVKRIWGDGTISSGHFTGIKELRSITIPSESKASFTLDKATTFTPTAIRGGSFSGTLAEEVTLRNNGSVSWYGGTYTAELKKTMDVAFEKNSKSLPNTYAFVGNDENGYIIKQDAVTLIIPKIDSKYGTLNISSKTASATASAMIDKAVLQKEFTRNAEVMITVNESTVKDGYEFLAWYYDPYGEGTKIADGTVKSFSVKLTQDTTTIYPVFVEKGTGADFSEKAEEWLGSYASIDSYTISDINDMRYFSNAVNNLGKDFSGKTVTLSADLAYQSGHVLTPVGTKANPFKGTFDGGNHKISGFTASALYAGVFGCVSGGTINGVTVKTPIGKGATKFGGVVGYTDTCSISNAHVEDMSATANSMQGAIIGHACAGENTLTNINVNTPDIPVVSSIYGPQDNFNLTINGENTSINADSIVTDAADADSKPIIIVDGKYDIKSIIANDGDHSAAVEISGGVFSVEVPSEYCAEGTEPTDNKDGSTSGTHPNTVGKIAITWTTDTDSGYYLNGEVQISIMRFLFDATRNTDAAITESGIKYFKVADAATDAVVGKAPETGTASTFYGDIIGEQSTTCYAKAYAKMSNGKIYWSPMIQCAPDFTRHFAELDKTTTTEGGTE